VFGLGHPLSGDRRCGLLDLLGLFAVRAGHVSVVPALFDLFDRAVPIALHRLQPERQVVVAKPRDGIFASIELPHLALELRARTDRLALLNPEKVQLKITAKGLKRVLKRLDRIGGHREPFPRG
jgi:hypothetical protein